jgi:hypothetical protein
MRTTNLYKVKYHDPEGPGLCVKGDIDVELQIGADTYDNVLRVLRRKDIKDEQIREIKLMPEEVIVDDDTNVWMTNVS